MDAAAEEKGGRPIKTEMDINDYSVQDGVMDGTHDGAGSTLKEELTINDEIKNELHIDHTITQSSIKSEPFTNESAFNADTVSLSHKTSVHMSDMEVLQPEINSDTFKEELTVDVQNELQMEHTIAEYSVKSEPLANESALDMNRLHKSQANSEPIKTEANNCCESIVTVLDESNQTNTLTNKEMKSHLEKYPNIFKCQVKLKRLHIANANEKTASYRLSRKAIDQQSTRKSRRSNQIGEKRFKCNVCKKAFVRNGNLKSHLLIHTQEKPFKCNICKKLFNRKSSLKSHLLIHTQEKPFKCNLCKESFNHKTGLKGHLLVHTGETPFKCNLCTKSFNYKSNLIKHLLIHTQEKPFKCNLCKKAFKQKSSLKLHLLNHTQEKPFKCNLCKKSFNRKSSLKSHLLIHTQEKPFKCNLCKKAFRQKSTLTRHLQKYPILANYLTRTPPIRLCPVSLVTK